MAGKWLKIIRFEPRFHHMKGETCRFHTVKARRETMHFNPLSGHVSIWKKLKKIIKNQKLYFYFCIFWQKTTFLKKFQIETFP